MTFITNKDYFFEVSQGKVAGAEAIIISARNQDIDSAASEDIWASGQELVYASSAQVVDVISDSANDDIAGIGAQTLTINGLDSAFVQQSETINMAGLSTSSTAASFLRVFSLRCRTAGSIESNFGTITASMATPGTQCVMLPEEGFTQNSHFTIPAGKTGFFISASADAAVMTPGANRPIVRVRVKVRELNGAWIEAFTTNIDTVSSGSTELFIRSTAPIPEKADIRLDCETTQNNVAVNARYQLVLITN